MTTGNYVLTYNPQGNKSDDIIAYIREHKLPVALSKVTGFGMPELRVGPGEYIRGVSKIMLFLRELRQPITRVRPKPILGSE